jgi:hypothetical protein
MSTLEIEKDLDSEARAPEAIDMIDCGRASERTRGFPFMILFELNYPPNDTLLL